MQIFGDDLIAFRQQVKAGLVWKVIIVVMLQINEKTSKKIFFLYGFFVFIILRRKTPLFVQTVYYL
jgi:hypothetical protein